MSAPAWLRDSKNPKGSQTRWSPLETSAPAWLRDSRNPRVPRRGGRLRKRVRQRGCETAGTRGFPDAVVGLRKRVRQRGCETAGTRGFPDAVVVFGNECASVVARQQEPEGSQTRWSPLEMSVPAWLRDSRNPRVPRRGGRLRKRVRQRGCETAGTRRVPRP